MPGIEKLISRVDKYSLSCLEKQIDRLEKAYLLQGRLEPDPDGALYKRTSCFRHYLRMRHP